ncbi:myosin-binding protein 2 [Daucus carota subsp. sativus]|uniref:myosin-binding protein 2 n=1 Tax=Daucus carota subsp. sativus TaxID=79200 RepID=UPI0007B2E36A|nr:PREDICTED: myosin-binding protein 2-like isoform X1 [Daucus carota subsp. sativus]
MGTNTFASMLNRNTNKFTLILVYALLEWTLIALLLLNSLLSYLIVKFAIYFGLKPPCFWCSRFDHFLQPEKGNNFNRDLLCEAHANEVSVLGYCRNHQKLVACQNMCEDCSSSRPVFHGVSKNLNVFSWVEEIEMIHDDAEKVFDDGVLSFKCSCCDVSLEKQLNSPHILDLECTKKENLMPDEEGNDSVTKRDDFSDGSGSDILVDHFEDDQGVKGKNEEHMIFAFDGGYSLIEGKDDDSDSSVSVSKFGLEELKGGDDDEVEMLLQEESDFFEEQDLSKVMEDLISDEIMSQACRKENVSMKIHPEHLEFFIDFSGHELVPVELIDLNTEENELIKAVENQKYSEFHEEDGSKCEVVARVEASVAEETKFAVFESMEMKETENSLVFYAKENYSENQNVDRSAVMEETGNSMLFHAKLTSPKYGSDDRFMDFEETGNSLVFHAEKSYSDDNITLATRNSFQDIINLQGILTIEGLDLESSYTPTDCEKGSHVQSKESELDNFVGAEISAPDAEDIVSYVQTVTEEESHIIVNETEVEVSIGTEIPDLESADETQAQDTICFTEEPSKRSANFHGTEHEHGMEIKLQQEETLRLGNLAIEISENMTANQLSVSTESNGTDEEKICDTPTSLDSFHHLHKKLLLHDGKESGTEESLDGSATDFESGDGVMTVECLTSALRAEKKALHVVYAELEEERSASAVAANQTMAMINRLQEEKAAMQMEALQYQRMMEEQSEYDQEALQLLNELMLKREREKQQLERELDLYQKKVMDYEAKEKMRMLKRSKDGSARSGFSSTSFSNGEDSDGISMDLNHEVKEEDGFYSHQVSENHNTPIDAVQHLGDSFGEFEEERMLILEQLKVLEDKLFTLSEDEHRYEDVRPIKDFVHISGNHLDENSDSSGEELNGLANGCSKPTNGIHHQEGRFMGANAKRLLPLFDAIAAENANGELSGDENVFESVVTRFELEERRVAIEEEVDQLYARMHALETDKEFLKHCLSSLKKGDKGMDLLQEILQHLRDLRNMELRVKDLSDGTLV